MAITVQALVAELQAFFRNIDSQANNGTLSGVPLLSGAALPPGARVFATLEDQVLSALGGTPDDADAIAAALRSVAGVTATVSGGSLDIGLVSNASIALANAAFDGGSVASDIGLNLQGSFASQLSANLDVALRVDGTTSELAIVDGASPELELGLTSDFAPQVGGKLGFINISVSDGAEAAHDIQLAFAFDLPTGDAGGLGAALTPQITGSAGLNLDVEASADFLPTISTNLVIEVPFATGVTTVSFIDIELNLGSYFGVLGKALKEVADVLNEAPLGQIFDVLTGPIPVIDDLAHTFGLTGDDELDRVGSDDVVSLLDLAVLSGAASEKISPFLNALVVLDTIRHIGDVAGLKGIDLGSFIVPANVAGAPDTYQGAAGPTPLEQADTNAAVLGELTKLADKFSAITGIELSLLKNPQDIVRLLLNAAFDPVTLINYDTPALTFNRPFEKFIPILGPIGAVFTGDVAGALDINLGYDTRGLENDDPAGGFFFSTPAVPGSPGTFEPAGSLSTSIGAGAGIRAVVVSADLLGSIKFDLKAPLKDDGDPGGVNDGKLRLDRVDCFFNPISGKATADLVFEITIDFGLFEFTDRIPLASTVLADFDLIDCPPPSGEPTSPPGEGLAELEPSGNLLLHTGDLATRRVLLDDDGVRHAGTDESEAYIIRNAVDVLDRGFAPGASSVVAPAPDQLDITAFGITQRFGAAGAPPAQISGKLGKGNDRLIIAKDVLQQATVEGEDGDDYISGGAGNDSFDGGANNDFLVGNDGDDVLIGGADDDVLDGGKGADTLDGGSGRDKVSYELANADTRLGIIVSSGPDGLLRAVGGEADGDLISNVEEIIGTAFADIIEASILGIGDSNHNTLEGRGGNDTLTGAPDRNDYLIGGAGGDTIDGGLDTKDDPDGDGNGGDIVDAASYTSSFGGIQIDLQERIFRGGEAQGDILLRIESILGSAFPDFIFGDANNNQIDGFADNDVLRGRGGIDAVSGGLGNDVIFGEGDGDTLDGGGAVNDPGIDLLSYAAASSAVAVNLKTRDGGGSDVLAGAQRFVVPAGGGAPVPEDAVGYSTFENLEGSNFNDTLTGDLAYNVIWGRGGADQINGDEGNDTLIGGAGGDRLDGGAGIDLADYGASAAAVNVNLLAGTGTGPSAASDALGDTFTFASSRRSTVENLRGSDSTDTLVGDDNDNEIDPRLGTPGAAEFVDGGLGNDLLIIDYSRDDVGMGVIGGFGTGPADSGGFLREALESDVRIDWVDFINIQRLHVVGTQQADSVFGGANDDVIITHAGNDTVYAGFGRDVVEAGDGSDFVAYGTNLAGNLIADRSILGAPDAFKLNGGAGIDTLAISLVGATENITLTSLTPAFETRGTNLALRGGGSISGFEIFTSVVTGSSDDRLTQAGQVDNNFLTGDGNDTITPGLGIDTVDGGINLTGLVPTAVPAVYQLAGDGSAFINAPGDQLVLDYSTLADGSSVVGSTTLVDAGITFDTTPLIGFNTRLSTNNGTYTTSGGANAVSFFEIERIDVTGTNQGDILDGTDRNLPIGSAVSLLAANRTGSDRLVGLGGDDVIVGHSGHDTLIGGDGNDTLQGADPFVTSDDPNDRLGVQEDITEVDTLTGGAGADLFVLGGGFDPAVGFLYADQGRDTSSPNQAIITDFSLLQGDRIQLFGTASQYRAEVVGGDSLIYLDDSRIGQPAQSELIATVRGFTGFDFNAAYVTYVNGPTPFAAIAAPPQAVRLSLPEAAEASVPAEAPAPAPESSSAVVARAQAGSFFVDRAIANDVEALKAKLGDLDGDLTIEGSSGSIAIFGDDPFGLGGGMVLSTGWAEDLVGPNTTEVAAAPAQSVAIEFQPLNVFNGTNVFNNNNIYVADLSGLGIDINSLTLQDLNSKIGGGTGKFSGFDLNAVVLSTTLLTPGGILPDLNNPADLPRLDVFDFSTAGVFLEPGTQRSGPINPIVADLAGSFSRYFLDNSEAQLGRFESSDTTGAVTLGDGGKISFNLTQPVSTNGPLYLYIAEQTSGTGEQVSGSISVSTERVVPDSDLSTDLGNLGTTGDATKLTYAFTPAAGLNQVEFQFVLFSEELPERGGALGDIVTIRVNGVDYAALSDGASATLDNLLMTSSGPAHPDLILNPAGTGPAAALTRADAYTRVLTLKAPVRPGVENTLEIEVADKGDAFLDTGILIKGGSLVARAGTDFAGGAISLPVAEGSPVLEPASLSIVSTDAIRAEGNGGVTTYTFTVYRTGDSSAAASASWAVGGQANAADFGGTLPSGTVDLAPGATSAQIVVTVSGDTAFESDEAFTVTLSNAVGAAIGVATASGKIINDDAGAPLSFLVSSDANGNVGNDDSGAFQDWIDISSNGHYVAFASQANNLVPDDTNNAIDVFVKDAWTGAITRVSTSSSGEQGAIFSLQAAISGDGRLAAFINGNNFDPADQSPSDVYVKDLTTGATVWATRMPGFSGGGDSDLAFSDNGRFLAFTTAKTLLNPSDDNFTSDVFVADLQTGSFTRASSTSTGAIANGGSSEASISGDGTVVAFSSTATNLATNDANGFMSDVYAKNLATGAVQLVSANAAGEGGNGQSFRPDVSANGRYVVFYSNSSNLVADDTNGGADIFRKDLQTGAIQRVNTLADGSQVQFPGGIAANSEVSISGDGRFVAFWGARVVPTVNFDHVFVKDMETGAVAAVPIGLDGLVSSASIIPRISTDGRYIAFSTGATNLVTNDANGVYDVYVKPNPLIGASQPIVSISDATVTEGDSGDTLATFTLTRTGGAGAFGVGFLIAGGTAQAGLDLAAGGGFLNFAAGQMSQTITIAVTGDTIAEGNETFMVNLDGTTNGAVVGDGQGLGTILDDDSPGAAPAAPKISIGDVAVAEGNAGSTTAHFTVSLSAAQATPTSVAYATADGTAKAGSDYTTASGTVIFAPGETTKDVAVTLAGDTAFEGNETFLVRLSDIPAGIAAGNMFGIGTIRNDDAAPAGGAAVTIGDVTIVEGDSGSALATFTVTRSVNDGAFSVGYSTQSRTADAPGDYTATTGTLAFAAGGALSQTITVTVIGDALDEANERFSVVLQDLVNISGTAFIADGVGNATITDNDAAPIITVGDAAVTEGNTGTTAATFTVGLSAASSKTIAVDYGAVSDTAISLVDFARTSGRLTFAPGETSKSVTVQINGDLASENDERFTLLLTNAVNATILDGQGSGTIQDDDIASFALGDRVWNDADGDGVQDAGEAGIAGVTVNLSIGGTLVASTTTAANGIYVFANLAPTTYTVTVSQPVGFAPSFDLDGIGTANSATVSLTANRADVDFGYRSLPNTPPVITFNGGNPASVSVAENTTGVATITVVDPDAVPQALALAEAVPLQQTLTFTISGADADRFAINSAGVLTFASPPDYENPSDAGKDNVYDVVVTVSDGANGSDSQAISVAVSNVNETPVLAPIDTDAAADAVTENATTGTSVGITARATDADGPDVVSYALTSNPGGLFAIDPATGVVTVVGAIDRETVGGTASIVVTATSTDGSHASTTFAIAVADADEFDVTLPEDIDTGPDTVAENALAGTLVGIKARALDRDATNNTVTYRLGNNAGGRFAIDPTSGVVAVAAGALLDFEAAASHRITVEAVSSDGSVSSRDFTIAVTDVNEPASIGGDRTGSVTEDITLSAAGRLTVSDPDAGQNTFQPGTITGTYGSLTLDADGAWTYALNNANAAVQALNSGQSLTDVITVQSQDGTPASITITINGTNDQNVITGNNSANVLRGTGAADIITPLGGPDAVFAGSGDDVIRSTPNDGADLYDGGSGRDTVDYSALTRSVEVVLSDLAGGTGIATGAQSGTDVLVSIENVIGSQAGDRLVGNSAANIIAGGAGADQLEGGGGNDRIEGGLGNDGLNGGPGLDTFVFKPGFGNDRISGFDANPSGGQDLIELSGFGITAANFDLRVAKDDIGADTLMTIDGDAGQTIRLIGIGNAATISVDDFRFA